MMMEVFYLLSHACPKGQLKLRFIACLVISLVDFVCVQVHNCFADLLAD